MIALLLAHTEQGVAWMLNMERSTNRLPFWKELTEKGQRVFFNEITNTSYTKDPGPPRGGILADDMGLGKTIQVHMHVAVYCMKFKHEIVASLMATYS